VCSFLSECKTARLSTRNSVKRRLRPHFCELQRCCKTAALQSHLLQQHSHLLLMSPISTASKWLPYITVFHFATSRNICRSSRYSRTPIESDTATASDSYETQPFRNSGNPNKYLPFQCCCRVYTFWPGAWFDLLLQPVWSTAVHVYISLRHFCTQ
jgi:hypothetical protein